MLRPIGSYHLGDILIELKVTIETFTAGRTEEIIVHMTDRKKQWEVRSASIALDVYYRTPERFETERVSTYAILDDLSPLTDFVEVGRISLPIPGEVPSTIGGTDVAARVTFESERATVDEEEFLSIEPCKRFRGVLASMIDLGFVLENSECRADRAAGGPNFAQVLTFAPRNSRFRGDVGTVDLFVQKDEKSTIVAADADSATDRYAMPSGDARITLSATNTERIRPRIERLVERASSA